MDAEGFNAETLFHKALELEPALRVDFLRRSCLGDLTLHNRVTALLEAHEHAGAFLPEDNSSTENIGAIIGRYKLLEKIGEGGFGAVWAAEQLKPIHRRVALKIIKLGMDTKQVIARFEAERQALAMMDHPNIAKFLDAGATDTGRPYFVMELVRGLPITNYCEEQLLNISDRLHLIVKICHAIQHAHQKGIIHRDIKPSNILVTLHDGVPVPKVIDFGIAKATQAELTESTIYTQFHHFIGTPAYMSPEQAERSPLDIDTRSDIYSLGVLLYEILTGTTPFDSKSLLQGGLDQMRRIIREQEPLRPSTKLIQARSATAVGRAAKSAIDRDLDWIVMKCLEKDRTRRYETASGLAIDLQRHLKNEPILARPPSHAYRLRKAFRRNKVAFVSFLLVMTALLVGFGVSLWQMTLAKRATKVGDRLLYTANMNLVQQAWSQNNIGHLRQLLEQTATSANRGFEWYYWQRQTHLEIKTLRGHSDTVWSLSYSPDGLRIATGSCDHSAKIWDATTGRETHTLKGHSDWVTSIAFSPDGQRIVTGSADQTARMWDLSTGRQTLIFKGHTHWINSLAFSPDGKLLLTGSHDNTAKVWDTASGKNLLTLNGHSIQWGPAISAVAFSPDGRYIVTGSHDSTAKMWDALDGTPLRTFIGHTGPIWTLDLSSDGGLLITGSFDRTAKVWEVETATLLHTLPSPDISDPGISSVAFSSGIPRVAVASWTHAATVWDTNGTELFDLKGHNEGITSVAFSPNGEQILTGSRDYDAKIWSAESAGELLTLRGHTAGISSIAFSPNGEWLVTASADHTIKFWETVRGRELFSIKGHTNEVFSAAFSPDGQRIVTGSADATAKVWNLATYEELFTLRGHKGPIASVAWSLDGRFIVTGSHDHTAKLWDSVGGKPLLTFSSHTAFINSVALSSDGQRISTGSYDGSAAIWHAVSGSKLRTFNGSISAITYQHPAWFSGAHLTLKGFSAAITSVAFSPDGQFLITGSQDGTASLWNSVTGEKRLTFQGHRNPVQSVAWSPDGRRIITGSHDHTAKLWETTGGAELLTLNHSDLVSSVAFSPDGQRIATGSADGIARIWLAAAPQQVALWQEEEKAAATRLARSRQEEIASSERVRALRGQDPGLIRQWLLLGPIPIESTNTQASLDREQIPSENQLHPRAGEWVRLGTVQHAWRSAQLKNYLLDFTQLVETLPIPSAVYAVSYIESEFDQNDVVLRVGSDDQSKIYLNGLEIHRRLNERAYIADQDVVSGVQLKAGINVLIFKALNKDRAWAGSVRFSDHSDQPLKGIKVTLDPISNR